MKVLIVIASILALASCQLQFGGSRRPLQQAPHKAVFAYKPATGSNDGRYTPDNSGAYKNDDGRYHPDNSGSYVHSDSKYKHDDDKYKHQAEKFGNGGAGGDYNGGNGGFGSGAQFQGGFNGNKNNNLNNAAGFTQSAGFGTSGDVSSTSTSTNQKFGNDGETYGKIPNQQKPGKAPGHFSTFGNANNGNNGNKFGSGNVVVLNQGFAGGSGDSYRNNQYRILRKEEKVEQDGYHYLYETENGIEAEEQGKLANVGTDEEAMRAHGFYTYTGPDNVVYTVRYTADENGFVPEGAHIPTPPPIPAAILRALEYQRSVGKL